MQEFYSLIVKDSIENDVIEQIRKERLPLYIWGCGEIAHILLDYMEDKNILIAGFIVDAGFQANVKNYLTTTFDKLREVGIQYNLLMGHSQYEKMRIIKDKYDNIQNVFYFVSLCYGQYEPIPLDFYERNKELYFHTYQLLEDDISRNCLVAYLNTRISNNIEYVLDCFQGSQNYFRNDIYVVGDNESYVDVGAYDGDSIQEFLRECNRKYARITAIEPNVKNFQELEHFVKTKGLENIDLIQCGTWKENTLLSASGENQNFSVSECNKGETISVRTLDDIIDSKEISLIKINFYQGVQETILGGSQTLRRCLPKMAIAIGFDEWALINIPPLLKQIVPEYKLYLRYNSSIPAKLVLYVVR